MAEVYLTLAVAALTVTISVMAWLARSRLERIEGDVGRLPNQITAMSDRMADGFATLHRRVSEVSERTARLEATVETMINGRRD